MQGIPLLVSAFQAANITEIRIQQAFADFWNAVQNRLNEWIASGQMRAELGRGRARLRLDKGIFWPWLRTHQ
jgi:hypothetical protein